MTTLLHRIYDSTSWREKANKPCLRISAKRGPDDGCSNG